MSELAASAWDHHADTYARMFAPLTGYIARSMVQMVDARLPAQARVLDIACGAGAVTVPVAQRALQERAATGRCGAVVAVDFAPRMVALTEAAAAHVGAGELVQGEVGNGEALTFGVASFDAVFSSFGIFLFSDRRAGWREAARVLRPGGLFGTAVWRGPEHNPMLRAQMGAVAQALPARLRYPQGASWLEVAEADALSAEVTAAGFTDVSVSVFHATIALPSAGAAWEAMRNNPVLGELFRQCSPEELDEVAASVLASLGDRAGGPNLPLLLDSACHILVARRA